MLLCVCIGGIVLYGILSNLKAEIAAKKVKDIEVFKSKKPRAECDTNSTLTKALTCTYPLFALGGDGQLTTYASATSIGQGNLLTTRKITTEYANLYTLVDGHTKPVTVVRSDDQQDTSLIHVDAEIPACSLFDKDEYLEGEDIYVVGHPYIDTATSKRIANDIATPSATLKNIEPVINKGTYSRKRTNGLLQFDAPTNIGSRGSPVFNRCGMIGIVADKLSWFDKDTPVEGISFAVAYSSLSSFLSVADTVQPVSGAIATPSATATLTH
jgi:S1-C subfamily serine protease